MATRIGSVAALLVLIGAAQYCQAARDEGSTTAYSVVGPGVDTKRFKQQSVPNKVGDGLDKEEAADETGQVKFENLGATVMEGVLDAPAPSPSSAFSALPTVWATTLALLSAVVVVKMV